MRGGGAAELAHGSLLLGRREELSSRAAVIMIPSAAASY